MNKMKKLLLTSTVALQTLLLISSPAMAASGNQKAVKSTASVTTAATTSVSLKQLAQDRNIHIGVATQTYLVHKSTYASVLNQNFDMITPEYQMKMGVIEQQPHTFDFTQADELVNYAAQNNQLVRGHTLVWHQSLPDWINNGQFTRSEWIGILKEYITTTVSHFKGKVYSWDVVNEAFWQNGDYRPSIWYTNIGPEYIELAFQFAHEADPNAKLFYNDFSDEVSNSKSNAIYTMLKNLKHKGVPIDGIGFQMHLTINGLNYTDMQANFKRFAALGLDTDVTEMDVVTHDFKGTEAQKLKAEADVYGNVFKALLPLPSFKAFVTWGLNDSQSWLNSDTGYNEVPLLFDDSFQPKPAYQAIADQLARK